MNTLFGLHAIFVNSPPSYTLYPQSKTQQIIQLIGFLVLPLFQQLQLLKKIWSKIKRKIQPIPPSPQLPSSTIKKVSQIETPILPSPSPPLVPTPFVNYQALIKNLQEANRTVALSNLRIWQTEKNLTEKQEELVQEKKKIADLLKQLEEAKENDKKADQKILTLQQQVKKLESELQTEQLTVLTLQAEISNIAKMHEQTKARQIQGSNRLDTSINNFGFESISAS